MTPEEYFRKTKDESLMFYAEKHEWPDYMRFTIEGKDIHASSVMHMEDVIVLYRYLENEITKWLDE